MAGFDYEILAGHPQESAFSVVAADNVELAYENI
jgi:hypothetical protein